MPAPKIIHADKGGELLVTGCKTFKMKGKALLWYALSVISLVVAVIIFLKSLDWKTLVILVFGIAAVLLFRQGMIESKK